MFDSVRVRLSLWHVGVVAFLLIAFSGAVYVLLSNILYSRSDAVLESVVDGTVSMLAKESSEIEFAAQAPRHALRALSYPDTSLAIFGEDGKLIAEKTDGGHRVSPPVGMTGFPLSELHQYTSRVRSAGETDTASGPRCSRESSPVFAPTPQSSLGNHKKPGNSGRPLEQRWTSGGKGWPWRCLPIL